MTSQPLFDHQAAILVVGDVILDGYASGSVDRISPEAPVPVLRNVARNEVPGGGANVAMNIAALGGTPHLIGLVGHDEEAGRLEALLGKANVRTRLIAAEGRPTTSKLRILAGNHQFLRIDNEDAAIVSGAAEDALVAAISEVLPVMRAVILSDYAKGCLSDRVLRETIDQARARNIPVFVDPKRADFRAYAGASFITPNRSELRLATGVKCDEDQSCRDAARQAMTATGAHILLTRSEQGMSLYSTDGEELLLPTETQEIFDVSGAGDTVVAAFALAIASGHPPAQALRLANRAAGIVIGKPGTATVSEAELSAAVEERHHAATPDGSVSWAQARQIRDMWRQQKLSVGFTNGCFDLLHPGHVALLREAARQCDRLIVALNSDASVRRLKGPTRPIQDEIARADVMCAISHVDLVVMFEQDTPLELITALEPDILVKGADYAEADIVGADIVKARGGRVLRIDIRAGHSTTELVARSRPPQDAAA